MLVREWIPYQKSLEALSLEYLDCPQYCASSKIKYDVYRFDLCEKCPKLVRKKAFQRATEVAWEKWLNDDADELNFNEVFATLHNVLSARELPDNDVSTTVNVYLSVYEAEKSRHQEHVVRSK